MDGVFDMRFQNAACQNAKLKQTGPFFIKVLLFLSFHLSYFANLKKTLCLTNYLTNSYSESFQLQLMSANDVFQFQSKIVYNPFQTQAQSSDQPLLLAVGEAIQLGPTYSGQINHGCNRHNYHQAFQNVTGSNTLRMKAKVTSQSI